MVYFSPTSSRSSTTASLASRRTTKKGKQQTLFDSIEQIAYKNLSTVGLKPTFPFPSSRAQIAPSSAAPTLLSPTRSAKASTSRLETPVRMSSSISSQTISAPSPCIDDTTPQLTKKTSYGEVGIGYSSMQEMLVSSGFLDTRIVTPLAVARPSTSNSSSTSRPIYPPYSRGLRRTFIPVTGERQLKSSKSMQLLRGVFSIFSTDQLEVDLDDQSSSGSIGPVSDEVSSRLSTMEWIEKVNSSSESGSASASSNSTGFTSSSSSATPPTTPRRIPAKAPSSPPFVTTSFSPPISFPTTAEYESFQFATPLSPIPTPPRRPSIQQGFPIAAPRAFGLKLRKSLYDLSVGVVDLSVGVMKVATPTSTAPKEKRQPGLRRTKSCAALPILTIPDISLMPRTARVDRI